MTAEGQRKLHLLGFGVPLELTRGQRLAVQIAPANGLRQIEAHQEGLGCALGLRGRHGEGQHGAVREIAHTEGARHAGPEKRPGLRAGRSGG